MGFNMNNLIKIQNFESIGNSLSSINDNYELLDNLIRNIQLSASKYWMPMANYYENRKYFWKTNALDVAKNIVNWQTASTLFETNSAKWVTPLTVWYPSLIKKQYFTLSDKLMGSYQNKNTVLEILRSWLNENYPVIDISGVPNYIQNQMAIVYLFLSEEEPAINSSYQSSDSTTCVTKDDRMCVNCYRRYSGGSVNCDNGSFSCGRTVESTACANVTCNFYDNFNKTNTKTLNSQINGKLTVKFKNSYESDDIVAAVYLVNSCSWDFVYLLSPSK